MHKIISLGVASSPKQYWVTKKETNFKQPEISVAFWRWKEMTRILGFFLTYKAGFPHHFHCNLLIFFSPTCLMLTLCYKYVVMCDIDFLSEQQKGGKSKQVGLLKKGPRKSVIR